MFLIAIIISGCVFHSVQPTVNGVHQIVFLSDEEGLHTRYSQLQAKRFCSKKDKSYTILDERSKYICSLSETEYIRTREWSSFTVEDPVVGHNAYTGWTPKNDDLGSLIAAAAAAEMAEDCYEMRLSFICE